MTSAYDTVDAEGDHSSEAQALLNEIWLSAEANDGSLTSAESMAATAGTVLFADKSVADNVRPAGEVALEPLEAASDRDTAHLRAQGHDAALQRSFSPLAALGLGFRYKVPTIVPFHD